MRCGAWLGLVAIAVASTPPALAADDRLGYAASERHSGAFVGGYLRLPFGGATETPRAGLRVSVTHQYRDTRAAFGGARYEGEALDLGFSADGASLRLAGQEVDQETDEPKSKWWKPLAIVAGVAAVGAAGYYGVLLVRCASGGCSD